MTDLDPEEAVEQPIDHRLSENQRRYLDWLFMTEQEREDYNEPVTEKEWVARYLKGDPKPLWNWRNRSLLFQDVYSQRLYQDHTNPASLHRILDKQRDEILDGTASPSLFDKYLKRLDDIAPPPVLVKSAEGMDELTPERLWEAVIDAAKLRGWTVKAFDSAGNEIEYDPAVKGFPT